MLSSEKGCKSSKVPAVVVVNPLKNM